MRHHVQIVLYHRSPIKPGTQWTYFPKWTSSRRFIFMSSIRAQAAPQHLRISWVRPGDRSSGYWSSLMIEEWKLYTLEYEGAICMRMITPYWISLRTREGGGVKWKNLKIFYSVPDFGTEGYYYCPWKVIYTRILENAIDGCSSYRFWGYWFDFHLKLNLVCSKQVGMFY